jgi:hypothetical protein
LRRKNGKTSSTNFRQCEQILFYCEKSPYLYVECDC